MQSFRSLLGARYGTNGRNPEDGRNWTILTTAQQVLKQATAWNSQKQILENLTKKGDALIYKLCQGKLNMRR
jgi:endonuclease III-like uncharacterized protein